MPEDRLPGADRVAAAGVHGAPRVYRDYTAKAALAKSAKSYENYKAKGGTIIQMTQAARENWARTMPNIALQWAAGLDKKGLPGTKLLNAYMAKMRAAKQPIIRQRDQE